MPEIPEWLDLSGMPGHVRYRLLAKAILEEPNDPEQTLQVALTHAELATAVGGALLVATFFPECAERVSSLLKKLQELSKYQEFLPD